MKANVSKAKKGIQQVLQHPLISGSAIIFIGTFLMSVGNYIYNLIMGRMLSVSDYGLLTSITSLILLVGLFGSSFTNIFVKFSAEYKDRKDGDDLKRMFYYSLRYLTGFAAILFLTILIGSPLIKAFLHVERNEYLLYIFLAIIFSLFLTLPQGILQGRMQFISLSFANLSQPIIKIIVGVALLSLGMGVDGPLIGIFLAVLVPSVVLYSYFIFFNLKKRPLEKESDVFRKQFKHYVYTYIFAGVGMALLSNTDILLVRYYFSETVSGQYAALSLMGKAIFYFIMPINFAFFPLIAYKKERKERLFSTVILAGGITVLATASLSFVYFLFPSLILRIFFPSPEYSVLTQYLGMFSLYIMVFSLATLFSSFFLSIGKTGVYKISLFAAALQIGLIVLFHGSLYQVIGSLFLSALIFFIILLAYYVKHGKD